MLADPPAGIQARSVRKLPVDEDVEEAQLAGCGNAGGHITAHHGLKALGP